eukprot:8039645-Alexandrium_andersonii.AAC.1
MGSGAERHLVRPLVASREGWRCGCGPRVGMWARRGEFSALWTPRTAPTREGRSAGGFSSRARPSV